MSSWTKRTTSFVTAGVLAGAPVLLVACVALCTPGTAHASEHSGVDTCAAHARDSGAADHQQPDTAHQAASAEEPPHHGLEAAAVHQTSAQSAPRLHGYEGACCQPGALAFGAVPAARDLGGAPQVTTVPDVAEPLDAAPAPSLISVASRPLPPPAPTRSPLVLRI